MKRLLYRKTNTPGIVRSSSSFSHSTNGARYHVQLDTNNLVWMIVDEVANMTAEKGSSASLHKLKADAKAALINRGIGVFEEDTRKPRGTYKKRDTA